MSTKKRFLSALILAMVGFIGVQGTAAAADSSTPRSGGVASAEEVRDLIVEASGATTERDITPKNASINQKSLKITSASCAKDSDWASYYVGPAKVGSDVQGVAGGTLCSGVKRFHTDPHYLPDTYRVWGLMGQVTDQAFPQANKWLYGLYLGSVGRSVYSNGNVATLVFTRPSGSGRAYPSLKRVRIVGSESRTIRIYRPNK